jgi:hypothetical protein
MEPTGSHFSCRFRHLLRGRAPPARARRCRLELRRPARVATWSLERILDEANAAAESLELTTAKNIGLQDTVVEKESVLEATRPESEALKASESAARVGQGARRGQVSDIGGNRWEGHDGATATEVGAWRGGAGQAQCRGVLGLR